MFLNPGFFILSLISSSFLFAVSFVLYSTHVQLPSDPHYPPLTPISPLLDLDLSAYLGPQTSFIPPHSLTAILPILFADINHVRRLLEPFLTPHHHVREVFVVCPDTIASSARRVFQRIFANTDSESHPDISLRFFRGNFDTTSASLRAAADSTTNWVLIMDDEGLIGLPQSIATALLHPPNIHLPFGPSGEASGSIRTSQSSYWGDFMPAQYLRPPFVMSISSLKILLDDLEVLRPQSGLHFSGKHLQTTRGLLLGGNLSNASTLARKNSSCFHDLLHDRIAMEQDKPNIEDTVPSAGIQQTSDPVDSMAESVFMILLPYRRDLQHLLPLICGMSKYHNRRLQVLIYDDGIQTLSQNEFQAEETTTDECTIQYEVLTRRHAVLLDDWGRALLQDWVGRLKTQGDVDVIICLDEVDPVVRCLTSTRRTRPLAAATVIKIPRSDLSQTEWMSSLTLGEWINWHSPSVDISVITNDRPLSLQRLLRSLLDARYFGDHLDLRVYVEQNCDEDTLKIVENMTWPFGITFIHRRVVHAGLLPAIVESWYPRNNDSYGILLEDDIELSPLFYAWVKMSLLRYRYGTSQNRIPLLFGISLYQQKNVELVPEGRRSFNPRLLFSGAGLEFSNTPYLSQVPCSWGAVYFPEHWREFHDFLAMRLSENLMTLEDDIVPHVRSNQWLKSWKRFFIELVFLRGYVMLYPNYEDFKSLSTNHLEVGSHVKDRSREKQDLFLLPLMPLEQTGEFSQLLDIPHRTLPPITKLPVLNLTGSLTSLEEIVDRGYSRRVDLTSCNASPELYNVRSLMCKHIS